MPVVLAFGDSLTWGADPETGARHPRAARWPAVLAAGLPGVEVIAEGLGGRTTVFDDHAGPCDRNGARALPVLLVSHAPLDLVILMLGTNDLKPALCGVAEGAHLGMRRLVEITRHFPWRAGARPPAILIVAPPPCVATASGAPAQGRSIAESRRLAGLYAKAAAELGTGFFDAGSVAAASPVDGVHLDRAATEAIGRALIPVTRDILARLPGR